jgi:hypothetical protein
MRLVTGMLFIILVLVQPFIHTLIFIQFRVNQEYIEKNLCEKKDVKENTCHGCCQLKKQFKKTDGQPAKETPKSSTIKVEITYCNHFPGIEKHDQYPFALGQVFVSHDPGFLTSEFINSIFHPPKSV